jgi:hypothetical protein
MEIVNFIKSADVNYSGVSCMEARCSCAWLVKARWEITEPLGFPVVPEVLYYSGIFQFAHG